MCVSKKNIYIFLEIISVPPDVYWKSATARGGDPRATAARGVDSQAQISIAGVTGIMTGIFNWYYCVTYKTGMIYFD